MFGSSNNLSELRNK